MSCLQSGGNNMALGDPFNTTYEGSYKGASSLGDNLVDLSNKYLEQKMKEKMLQQEFEKQKALQQSGSDVEFNQTKRTLPLTEASDIRKSQAASNIAVDQAGKMIPVKVQEAQQLLPGELQKQQGVSDIALNQAKSLSSFEAQQKQQMEAENARKTAEIFGLNQTIQPKSDDFENKAHELAKTHGVGLNLTGNWDPSISEEAKTNYWKQLFQMKGIPESEWPQPTQSTTIDKVKLSKLMKDNPGLKIPIEGGGEFTGQQHQFTPAETALQYKQLDDAMKHLNISGAVGSVGAKGNTSIKPETANSRTLSDEDAKNIADRIQNGNAALSDYSKYQSGKITKYLPEDFNIKESNLAYKANQSAMNAGEKIQDAKVNLANNIMTTFKEAYDPKTGEYKIPPSQHVELAMNYAKMQSPTGVIAQDLVNQLTQGTAKEKMARIAIYFGADPAEVGGSTQTVLKWFRDNTDAQAKMAVKTREQYQKGRVSDYIGVDNGGGGQQSNQPVWNADKEARLNELRAKLGK